MEPARTSSTSGVGVGAASRSVGVASATLRVWERRYGLRPSARTVGGHRRYSPDDLTALRRVRELVGSGMPTAQAAALACSGIPGEDLADARADGLGEYARLAAATDALATHQLARLVRAVVARRGVVDAWQQVFAPQLDAMGSRWSRTHDGAECEHVAVAVLESVMRTRALRVRPRAGRGTVLLAAAPGERHTLVLDVLAAALAEAGVSTCVVYELPGPALHTARARTDADMLVLWARRRQVADVPLLGSFTATVPAVCAAGPGWPGDRLPHGVRHLTDLAGAVDACVEHDAPVLSASVGQRP